MSRRLDPHSPWVRLAVLIGVVMLMLGLAELYDATTSDLPPLQSLPVAADGTPDLSVLIGRPTAEAVALVEAAGYQAAVQPVRLGPSAGLRDGVVLDVSVEHNQDLVPGARLILSVVQQVEE